MASRFVANRTGPTPRESGRLGRSKQFLPPALSGKPDSQGLAIFCHGAAGDVEAFLAQHLDQLVVRQNRIGIFRAEQNPDPLCPGLGRTYNAAVSPLDAT